MLKYILILLLLSEGLWSAAQIDSGGNKPVDTSVVLPLNKPVVAKKRVRIRKDSTSLKNGIDT
jgi:hypothetical protein